MLVTSSAIATIAARPGGIVCNHGRARHSSAAHVSPIHNRNIEPPARSAQKLSCNAWRASAITSATSSAINTIAKTAGEAQKSGRKNVGALAGDAGDPGDEDGARVSEADAAMTAVKRYGLFLGASLRPSLAAANSASLSRNSVEMSSSP